MLAVERQSKNTYNRKDVAETSDTQTVQESVSGC